MKSMFLYFNFLPFFTHFCLLAYHIQGGANKWGNKNHFSLTFNFNISVIGTKIFCLFSDEKKKIRQRIVIV